MKIKKFISLVIAFCIVLSVCSFTEVFAGGAGDGNGIIAYGVDVSRWQEKIDWQKVKSDGKTFAILRIGTTMGKDTYFEENYKNAKAAGIDLGCYFYTYATTVEEAKADADMVLSWLDGKQLEYPVYYDMENEAQLASGITTAKRTEMCLAFLDKMYENNWICGTYANANWFSNYLNKDKLGEKYELWLASWMDSKEPTRDYSSQYGLWQYTDKGKVNGIAGNVDLDVAYKNYPAMMKDGGYNGYSVVVEEVDEEWIITSSNGVNVREGSGTSFDKIGSLSCNARIHITAKVKGTQYTWGKFDYYGKTGWCVLDYAKQTKSELIITDENLALKNKLISGLKPGHDICEDMFSVSGFAEIEIQPTETGNGTGTEVRLVLGNTIVDTYYVVIDGDINGDLYIDAFDLTYSIALANFYAEFEETSPQYSAADINKDGVCDLTDCSLISIIVNGEEQEQTEENNEKEDVS